MSWTFKSRHKNLRIWLRVPTEHYSTQGKLIVDDPGVPVEFHGGYYETDDPKIAEALQKHHLFGVAFELVDGTPVTDEYFKGSSLDTMLQAVAKGPRKDEVLLPKEEEEEKPKKRTYRCKECGAEFPSVYHLTKHKREAHPES
ncbi:MAG: hypothetical protein DRP97_07380 [Candidatus Latescibacterota bacterium]|nr:MAG: hypothetical protein DRP97_07380 [Candidatus Latescibacterota bacterium]